MPGALETVIECVDLDAMVEFFVDEVGCRIESITPADAPREFVVAGHGARLRLVRAAADVPGRLRLARPNAPTSDSGRRTLTAPNGTVLEVVDDHAEPSVPENRPSLSVVRATPADHFGAGRAGMGYRDLLPDRWGGRFIASHIMIPDGGDVADYVHYHRIRFQLIFVAAGWVDVVYEGQGEPFRMVAGDCVIQPPEIRHRVLRSSPGLEVIEIGCPAEHDTLVEHELTLPTTTSDATRTWAGQRFVRHVAESARSNTSPTTGFTEIDTGVAGATDGLADVRVLRRDLAAVGPPPVMSHDGEFAFYVVLAGAAALSVAVQGVHRTEDVGPRDAVALPPGCRWSWQYPSPDLEMLQVVLPAGCIKRMDGDAPC